MPLPHLTHDRAVVSPSNRFYILDGLPKSEASASLRTNDDVLDAVMAQGLESFQETRAQVCRLACPDPAAFDAAIVRIRADAEAGARPLMFIHGHGDKDAGLQLASGASIPWSDYLKALESITRAACGELTVIAAFCHSMAIIPLLPTVGRLPFAFYYGYDHIASAGQVQDETAMLYSSFLKDGGQTASNASTALKCYDEYDHIAPALAQFCALGSAPVAAVEAFAKLSKRGLRRNLEERLLAEGQRPRGVGKTINTVLRSDALVEKLVAEFMYDTERRRRLIRDVHRWRDQTDHGGVPSDGAAAGGDGHRA